jgi:hypothetical protein
MGIADVKYTLEQAMNSKRCSFTISLASALDGMCG